MTTEATAGKAPGAPKPEVRKPMDPGTFAILVGEMEAFLRVPKVDYGEWAELDEDIRAALLAAARRIETERLILLARAVRSEDDLLRLAAMLDGGEALVRVYIGAALDEYTARRKAALGPPPGVPA